MELNVGGIEGSQTMRPILRTHSFTLGISLIASFHGYFSGSSGVGPRTHDLHGHSCGVTIATHARVAAHVAAHVAAKGMVPEFDLNSVARRILHMQG